MLWHICPVSRVLPRYCWKGGVLLSRWPCPTTSRADRDTRSLFDFQQPNNPSSDHIPSPARSSPPFTASRAFFMPKTRGLVDPAPVDQPPAKPGPVKRSTSLVSLPTPPRTLSKRKRARSRVTDSDSEEDEHVARHSSSEEDSGAHGRAGRRDANGALVLGNKKRKTLDAIAEELSEAKAEEAFWMSESTGAEASAQDRRRIQPKSHYRVRSRSRTRSPSSSPPPAPHLLRRGHTGLASPPPSRRQPRTRVRERPPTPPPVPPTRTRRLGLFPTRDSPNNPFLADDPPQAVSDTELARVSEPRTPEPLLEKPTITWVL